MTIFSALLSKNRRPLVVAVGAFLLAASVSAKLLWSMEQDRQAEHRARVEAWAKDSAHALENSLERSMSATYALAALVRQGKGDIADFDVVAHEMLHFYPGVSALELSPGGIIRKAVPLAGNEGAIGFDQLGDPQQGKEAIIALATGSLMLAGPMNLVQGGFGAVGRLPVFLEDEQGKSYFWGFTNVVMRFPETLVGTRLPQLVEQGLDYELYRIHPQTGQKQTIAASSTTPLIDPVAHDLELAYGNWTMSVAPAKGWGDPLGLWARAALGLLFSLLLGYVAMLVVRLREHEKELEQRVTERTQELARLNDELATREALFRQILDTSSVAIFLLDMQGRITQANQRMAEMFARPLETLVGSEYVSLLHPAEQEEGRQKILALLKSDIPSVNLDRLYQLADGSAFWGHLTGKRFQGLRGEDFGLIGVIVDITERKQAETELRIAATTFEAQEGMTITDARQVILKVNRAFTEITGYSADEAVGQTPNLLNSGRHDKAFYEAMWREIERSGSWQGEIWNRRKSGDVYPEWLTITAVKADDGTTSHYVGTFADITLRKAAEDEIKHLAFYDPLTRLPNRRLLLDRLHQALAASARSGHGGALLFIDLDNFKTLNDTLGHDKGDILLQQVAQRLATCVREGDTVARLGGDEFVVMLEDLSDNPRETATQAEIVGEKILTTLNQTDRLTGHEHHSTPSIGVTLFSAHQNSVEELLKRADLAMYQAKAAGRNSLRFFDPEMQAVVSARANLEADLRQGIVQGQFLLYYQAQVIGEGRLTGAEALLRWQHPARGLVSPAEFIPLAEESGLILPLGHWVLETACAQLVAWAAQPETQRLTVAVNVSARQFRHPDFVNQVMAILDNSGADPTRLKLELTESLLLDDVEDIIAKMTALKARGVGFSLDDFGTGYSSLSYLKRLPLDQLKIDQSFVRDVFTDINDAAIAQAIIALSQTMGLSVIAEGVETEEQRDFLSRLGCQAYQGYLFGRAGPAADLLTRPARAPGLRAG